MKNRIFGFVGLGLMGGSLAKAIKFSAGAQIFACDIKKDILDRAIGEGVIDKLFFPKDTQAMLQDCDVVFICLYPRATLDFILCYQNSFKSGSIITDIAGVKIPLVNGLSAFMRPDVDFIPGHPMAGSEKEGYEHSSADIFKGRNYLFMPQAASKPENLMFLENLARCIGFTGIIRTDAKTHDHKIAFTSQLCHIIAAALVESAEDTNITAFGGGSYEDLTRIAMINAPLWTELFLENRTELLHHIDSFEHFLNRLKLLLENRDARHLQDILEQVRSKRIAMSKIK